MKLPDDQTIVTPFISQVPCFEVKNFHQFSNNLETLVNIPRKLWNFLAIVLTGWHDKLIIYE